MLDIWLEEFDKLREENPHKEITAWDVFLSLTSGKQEKYLLTLKADIDILRKIAEGNSLIRISRALSIPSKSIREVASTWGMEPLIETLDFNPLIVYNRGMTAEEMWAHVETIVPSIPDVKEFYRIVLNAERYNDLIDFLKESDNA